MSTFIDSSLSTNNADNINAAALNSSESTTKINASSFNNQGINGTSVLTKNLYSATTSYLDKAYAALSAPNVDSASLVNQIRDLMKLLMEVSSILSDLEREESLNFSKLIESQFKIKLDAMTEAADKQYQAAIKQAIGQVISGSISVIGGLASSISLFNHCKNTPKPGADQNGNKLTVDPVVEKKNADFQALTSIINSVSSGAGKVVEGAFGIDAAKDTHDKAQADIATTTAEHALEQAKNARSDAKDRQQKVIDFISNTIRTLSDILHAQADAEKNIARGA